MAAPTVIFRGKATVEGCDLSFDAIATNATAYVQSAKITQAWEDEIIKDNHGYDAMWMMRNEHASIDIDLYLVATTAAIAKAPVQAVSTTAALSALGYPFLAPGTTLVLKKSDGTTDPTLSSMAGTWRLLSGADATLTNTGAAKYTVKVMKYANADQNTAFATIPT